MKPFRRFGAQSVAAVVGILMLLAPLAASAGTAARCPTPTQAVRAVRGDFPIVANYRAVLAAAHCANLHCPLTDYQTEFAEMDLILFDRARSPMSAATVRFIVSDRPIPPLLAAAERSIERGRFRQAFSNYLEDFQTNASSVRTLYLDDNGDTDRVRSLLEKLTLRPATVQIAASLAAISDRHPDELAPLLYLGAVLLERGCKPQAVHIYRVIPYVRPVQKATYSGVSVTAMRLASSIDPNAWRRSPADRPPQPSGL